MGKMPGIHHFADLRIAEIFTLVRDVYLSSAFMSDHFDRKFPTIDSFADYYNNMLKQPGSFFMIAKIDNRAAGYLTLEVNPAQRLSHTAGLNMGIVEEHRGKGIGRALLNEAIQTAKTENIVEIIYLMVREDHTGAIKLYESSGFKKMAFLEKDTKIGTSYFTGILMRRLI
ncbi:MAG: GNAT family N-acetyltransferase [Bacteroidales bacterium]|nr:GNAT family N-acetyltransferase [Bacteroidales bacterium]